MAYIFYFEAMVIIVLIIAIFPQILRQTSDDSTMSEEKNEKGNDNLQQHVPQASGGLDMELQKQVMDMQNNLFNFVFHK